MMYDVILHYAAGDVFIPVLGVAEARMVEDLYSHECEVSILPRVGLYLAKTNRGAAARFRLIKGGKHA
jgi:hypothetical protein